jgi:V/A-type H+/Na+-transporting ATPase subunit I
MPVARMSKVSVLAPADARDELVERLHSLGAVHVVDFDPGNQEEEPPPGTYLEPDTRQLRLALARAEFILQLFERLETAKKGLLASFIQEKVHLTMEEFLAVEGGTDLEGIYREMESIDIEIRRVDSDISKLRGELESLRPWRDFDYPLGEAKALREVEFHLVVIPNQNLPGWEKEMDTLCPLAVWEAIEREGERLYLAVAVHRSSAEDFSSLASEYDLEQVELEGKEGTVQEEISLVEGRLTAHDEEKEGLEKRIREKSHLKPSVLALKECLENHLMKEEVKGKFLHTRKVVGLQGWIEESRIEEMREGLGELGETMDVGFSSPAEQDSPPTLMVNRPRIRPAETLVQLFGVPSHAETDPTPFVAPFFILFFGMCIGDVGYGAILALAFWLGLKKLDVSENTRKFLCLFMYCGIVSIVVGILTAGYFGIDSYLVAINGEASGLPGFFKFPGTMDLLYEPIPFMLICLALGLIHISIGVAIEMRDNMRHNSVWLGICEQGTTLLSWLGLAILAIGFGAGLEIVSTIGMVVLIAGVAGVIFLSNISSKSIAGKFFGGLYNLYGLFASTIGDVASYLRLYALGLATIAIATVINIMAGLVWGLPILGIVLLALVLLGGHLFNLAVSFLSAFVHPLRLQYVEFFGKFYEDGGEPFDPLALRTNRIVIEDR